MIGTPPLQCKVTDIPSFVNKLHTSLHSAYIFVRAHIASSHQCNKERYDKHGHTPLVILFGYMFLLLNQAGQRNLHHNGIDLTL